MQIVVAFDAFAVQLAPVEHVAYVAEVLDASLFAFFVVVDIHKLPPLLALAKHFSVTHEVACANDFAVICEPLDDFRCGHGFAKVDFVVEYHDVGTPKFWFMHCNHSIVSVSGQSP